MSSYIGTGNTSTYRIPIPNKKRGGFPNPFLDVSSMLMPNNIKEMFKWAEHIYLYNGIVSQCIERVVKYPITDLIFEEPNTDIHEKYKTFFIETKNVKDHITNCGIDLFVYGNSFTSTFLPFTRILKCPKCKMETPVDKALKVEYTSHCYKATCRCGERGKMEAFDRRSLKEDDTNFVRWNPHNIDISYNPITGKYQYYYKIDQEIKRRVEQGDLHLINGMPWPFLEAIKKNQMIKFSPGSIYHMKQPSLAGLAIEWGMPPVLRTFKQHYHVAVLRRANEAIAQDYVIPIRMFFPQAGPAGNDPGLQLNLAGYKQFLADMVEKHRRDPADAYFSPIPVGYQALGGEAKALNVTNEITAANEEIMASMGFPRELFYGTMSVQAAPMALRVFENTFSHYINTVNNYIAWLAKKVGNYFNWDPVKPKFAPVTMVDDAERKGILLQLAGSQMIARDTLLQSLGTDVRKELEKQMQEQQISDQIQKQYAQKQESMAMLGEGAQAQGTGASVMGLQSQAEQVAMTWLQMPEGQRRSQMDQMSRANPSLYGLAKSMMEKLRAQGQSEAYYAAQGAPM